MDLLAAAAPRNSREEWLLQAVAVATVSLLAAVLRFTTGRTQPVRLGFAFLGLGLETVLFVGRQLVGREAARSALGTAAVLAVALVLGRLGFLLLFDVLVRSQRKEPVPRIVRDIVQALIFMVIALFTLRSLGIDPGHLLTTSALLTVGVGLALQETLGNLLAGLALEIDRPFEIGDWIHVHGSPDHIGQIREVNWRATRIRTLDNVDVILPNGLLAKTAVTNYDRPHHAPRRVIEFQAPYDVSPLEIQELVLRTLAGTPGVLQEPKPTVVTRAFAPTGVEYSLRYYIADMGTRDALDGSIHDRLWYAFSRKGIIFPLPAHTIQLHEVTDTSLQRAKARLHDERVARLSAVDIFTPLSPEDLERLASHVRLAPFTTGELVIRQGEQGDSMFVVQKGELSVRAAGAQGELEVARLKPGAFFGEMSLLTGEARSATVVAQTPCELFVIDHAAFEELLATHPDVAQRISQRVVERQIGLQPAAPKDDHTTHEVEARSSALVGRILRFFGR